MLVRPSARAHVGLAVSLVLVLGGSSAWAQESPPTQPVGETDEPVSPTTVDDRDADAVLDDFDRCPDEPEVYNGVADDDGCPDAVPPNGEIQGTITAIIPLVGRRLQIAREAPRIIGLVLEILREHPGIEQLTIEAHTDARGSDGWNLRLSQARADYVRDELVRRGIAASRLVAVGQGERCPLVQGVGPRVWNRNRRIVFLVTRSRDRRFRAAPSACAPHAAP